MATVYPISSALPKPPTPAAPDTNFGQGTFLKLLDAPFKYQDPMHPADSTQYPTQTAQFPELETLQKIEKEQQALAAATQALNATSMVSRQVTYSLTNGTTGPVRPTPTSLVSVRGALPKDASVGAHATTTTQLFTGNGSKIPLTLDFTRTESGWKVQASSGGQLVGSAAPLSFDASGDRTSGNVMISRAVLDSIPGTAGNWAVNGITLAFGDSNDPTRLQLQSGPATVTVAEQNGNDGSTASGVVTGVHLTADGPQLVIGGQNIPLASITDVQA